MVWVSATTCVYACMFKTLYTSTNVCCGFRKEIPHQLAIFIYVSPCLVPHPLGMWHNNMCPHFVYKEGLLFIGVGIK